jgi:SAM-dependent methyltransferase
VPDHTHSCRKTTEASQFGSAAAGAPARILDIGCGERKAPGALGIDCRALPTVDIVHDLDAFPWPFRDGTFELIICSHILEHVADVGRFLREVHRIAAANARVRIETPHFSSLDSWTDPSHRHHLSTHSFDFFTSDGYLNQGAIFHVERVTLTFRKALSSRLGAFLFRHWPRHYEQNLAYLIPARDIHAELIVLK